MLDLVLAPQQGAWEALMGNRQPVEVELPKHTTGLLPILVM